MAKQWDKMTADEKIDRLRSEMQATFEELRHKAATAMSRAEEAYIKLQELEEKVRQQ